MHLTPTNVRVPVRIFSYGLVLRSVAIYRPILDGKESDNANTDVEWF